MIVKLGDSFLNLTTVTRVRFHRNERTGQQIPENLAASAPWPDATRCRSRHGRLSFREAGPHFFYRHVEVARAPASAHPRAWRPESLQNFLLTSLCQQAAF